MYIYRDNFYSTKYDLKLACICIALAQFTKPLQWEAATLQTFNQ